MQVVEASGRSDPGRGAAALGIASLVLLLGSIEWAHHWNPLAGALVAGWAATTIGTLLTSGRALNAHTTRRFAAKLGLTLGLLSVLVLAIAGLAFAAGGDPAGACGGG